MVDAAAAAILADSDLYDAWLGPVQYALDPVIEALGDGQKNQGQKNGPVEALLERIPEIYRAMDTAALEAAIAGAMFAGDVNGRMERLAILPGDIRQKNGGQKDVEALAEGDVPDFMTEPDEYSAALEWFDRKATMPTGMSSAEISLNVPGPTRLQAFFSARVASANVLESLRGECRAILDGTRSETEAASRLREFLAREGYGIPKPKRKEDGDLTNLASDRRLRLVLRQNVAMAQAVGRRSVSEHPEVLELFPNYRYSANTERHARYDGLVLPKSDPFWDTHYPPWDFGCLCLIYDTDEPAARGAQNVRDVPAPKSGFVFDSRPAVAFRQPDPAIVDDELLRRIFADELTEKERELLGEIGS